MPILKFSELFPNAEKYKTSDYLKNIPRNEIIKVVSAFITNFDKDSKWYSTTDFLNNFIVDETQRFAIQKQIDSFYSKLPASQRQVKSTFIDVYSCLKIIEIAITKEEPSEPKISIKDFNELILLAMLTENENRLSNEEKIKQDSAEAMIMTRSMPDYDIAYKNIHNTFIAEAIKCVMFFDYLENSNYNNYLQEFLKEKNIKDKNQYLGSKLSLVSNAILYKSDKNGHSIIVIDKNENYNNNLAFFKDFCAKNQDVKPDDADFLTLRENSLIETKTGEFLIINDLFLIELLFKSFFFTIKDFIIDKNRQKRLLGIEILKGNKDPYNDISKKFIEEKLFYTLLDSILSKWYVKKQGVEFERTGIDGMVDYYAWDGNNILLAEMKACTLDKETKQSFDYDIISEKLRSKINSKTKEDNDRIGIPQLIYNIKKLIDDSSSFDSKKKDGNLKVYPILVMNDFIFCTSGINNLAQKWFEIAKSELPTTYKANEKSKNILIKPLTLIHIDTIILNEDIFTNKISLIQAIDAYHDFVNKKQNVPKHENEHMNWLINNKMTSFDIYFNQNIRTKYKDLKVPKRFKKELISTLPKVQFIKINRQAQIRANNPSPTQNNAGTKTGAKLENKNRVGKIDKNSPL